MDDMKVRFIITYLGGWKLLINVGVTFNYDAARTMGEWNIIQLSQFYL